MFVNFSAKNDQKRKKIRSERHNIDMKGPVYIHYTKAFEYRKGGYPYGEDRR